MLAAELGKPASAFAAYMREDIVPPECGRSARPPSPRCRDTQ